MGEPSDEVVLSVDIGTTNTAAAILVEGERQLLSFDGRSSMPSTVLVRDDGELVVGVAAESRAATAPDRVERCPKRRIGDPVMLLGDRAVAPAEALSAILGAVAVVAAGSVGSARIDRLVLTHPARWGVARLNLLREAARESGLPSPVLVSEPVAAAAHLADDLTAEGDLLAVYDLGGGTFDTAIVRRTAAGFEVAGPPGGDELMGGETFDDVLVLDVRRRLPPELSEPLERSGEAAWNRARHQLRSNVRAAKEALSGSSLYRWYEAPPIDCELQLSQGEVETLLRSPIESTVDDLRSTIQRSGLRLSDMRTVVMAGGGARVPLVGRLLAEAVGAPPATWGDPKAAVCLGALLIAEFPDAGPDSEQVDLAGLSESPIPGGADQVAEPAAVHTGAHHDGGPAAGSVDDAVDAGSDEIRSMGPADVELSHLLPVSLEDVGSDDEPLSDVFASRASNPGPDATDVEVVTEAGPSRWTTCDPDPLDAIATEQRRWTTARIGATVAVGLVSLGVVSGVLAFLLR